MLKFMIGTMDGTVPARCENSVIADALGCPVSELSAHENDALGLAAEIAATLYGDNADAFIINE